MRVGMTHQTLKQGGLAPNDLMTGKILAFCKSLRQLLENDFFRQRAHRIWVSHCRQPQPELAYLSAL